MENVIALYSRDRIEIVSVTQARGVNMMMMAVFMTYKSKANIVTNDLYETFSECWNNKQYHQGSPE